MMVYNLQTQLLNANFRHFPFPVFSVHYSHLGLFINTSQKQSQLPCLPCMLWRCFIFRLAHINCIINILVIGLLTPGDFTTKTKGRWRGQKIYDLSFNNAWVSEVLICNALWWFCSEWEFMKLTINLIRSRFVSTFLWLWSSFLIIFFILPLQELSNLFRAGTEKMKNKTRKD